MITLLSPSKGQNFTTPPPTATCTTPVFTDQIKELIQTLKPYTSVEIQQLMAVSEKIADLNVKRFEQFTLPFTQSNSKQAIFSFTGDVYSQIEANRYSDHVLEFGQQHLRILSGLYGILRPLDLIQPYRLEMKTKLATAKDVNLYQFWGERLQDELSSTLKSHTNKRVVNLASNEYFKAVKAKKKLDILTINFKEVKNGKARVIAIFAKRARGLMANYIMLHTIDDHLALKGFSKAGYIYSDQDSDQSQFTFTRPQPVK
jgi:cytoplasmic iron level regulating protein YaaA (DUF328/UPF0246 family)